MRAWSLLGPNFFDPKITHLKALPVYFHISYKVFIFYCYIFKNNIEKLKTCKIVSGVVHLGFSLLDIIFDAKEKLFHI